MATSRPSERHPKRVILRLRVNEFDGHDSSEYNNAIKAYLTFADRSEDEVEQNRHYAHIEPLQAPELQQTSFHIILDLEKDSLYCTAVPSVPHEIYRVRRHNGEGNFRVQRIQNVREEQNMLAKMRKYTDMVYAWGK